jgi:CRP-like cAMP-binding protein
MSLDSFKRVGSLSCFRDGDCFPLSKHHVYRVETGYVKVIQINQSGLQRVKYVIVPGDVFGSLAFLMQSDYDYQEYGIAYGFVELSVLPIAKVQQLFNTDEEF